MGQFVQFSFKVPIEETKIRNLLETYFKLHKGNKTKGMHACTQRIVDECMRAQKEKEEIGCLQFNCHMH